MLFYDSLVDLFAADCRPFAVKRLRWEPFCKLDLELADVVRQGVSLAQMHNLDDFRYLCLELLSSSAFQQILPLVFVLFLPLLVLTVNAHQASVISSCYMVLDALAGVLPWNWFEGHSTPSSSPEKRKSKKKHVRSRAEQVEQEGHKLGMYNTRGHLTQHNLCHRPYTYQWFR